MNPEDELMAQWAPSRFTLEKAGGGSVVGVKDDAGWVLFLYEPDDEHPIDHFSFPDLHSTMEAALAFYASDLKGPVTPKDVYV